MQIVTRKKMYSQITTEEKQKKVSSLSNNYTAQISHHFITDGLKLEHEVILKNPDLQRVVSLIM